MYLCVQDLRRTYRAECAMIQLLSNAYCLERNTIFVCGRSHVRRCGVRRLIRPRKDMKPPHRDSRFALLVAFLVCPFLAPEFAIKDDRRTFLTFKRGALSSFVPCLHLHKHGLAFVAESTVYGKTKLSHIVYVAAG
jgi:hypothetical protein